MHFALYSQCWTDSAGDVERRGAGLSAAAAGSRFGGSRARSADDRQRLPAATDLRTDSLLPVRADGPRSPRTDTRSQTDGSFKPTSTCPFPLYRQRATVQKLFIEITLCYWTKSYFPFINKIYLISKGNVFNS